MIHLEENKGISLHDLGLDKSLKMTPEAQVTKEIGDKFTSSKLKFFWLKTHHPETKKTT